MTTYKSKHEFVLIIPLVIILGVFGLIMALNKVWPGLFIMIVIASIVAHMFLTTYYQIDGRALKIKSGFLFNKTVAIDSIRKITAAKSPLSSASATPGRLEINYNKSDSIIISPKDKAGFLDEIKKINPGIEFDLK